VVSAAARELTLHLERTLPAPPRLVFAMFTGPELFAKWFGPKGFTVASVAMDARVGGEYRVEMQPPEGSTFFLGGEFRRVDAPTHLSFTFVYEEPDPDDRETIVEIQLETRGASTELILDQRPFLTEARLALHTQGWSDSLDRLAGLEFEH
jgi:uncharacterized protein YndB with AHSA1/START domain